MFSITDYRFPRSRNQCEGELIRQQLKRLGLKHLSDYFPRVIYLQDMGVEISGLKFFGSPW